MAVLYDPEGHALLSTDAAALDAETLDAWAETAERELGLKGTEFEGEDADTATLAVVHWINCQLSNRGGRVIAKSKGDQSVRYAEGGETDCDRAAALVASLFGRSTLGEFEPAGGLR